MPFLARHPTIPDRWVAVQTVDLRQLPVTRRWKVYFEVISDVAFTDLPADAGGHPPVMWTQDAVQYLVPRGMRTDLASVPFFLWGVIASYGRQTLPAVLHDMLCYAAAQPGQPVSYRRHARRDADRLFRVTLAASGSGVLRRWLMWAAVRLFGHASVAIAFLVTAAALTAGVLGGWPLAWWGAVVGAVVVLVSAAVAAVESERVAAVVGEYSSARFVPAAWGSLLGAVAIASVSALPIAVVGAATLALELVVGLGERSRSERVPVTVQAT